MTTFLIKIIAITTMVVDHVGLYFFPQYWTFRIIGRLSFILFAWLIANGAKNTKDMKKYLVRLLLLGVVSQYPFYYINNISDVVGVGLNIGFTLALGLLMIMAFKRVKNKYLRVLCYFGVLAASVIFKVDYGPAGVLSIFLFYYYFDNFKMMFFSIALVYLSFYLLPISYKIIYTTQVITSTDLMKFIQPFALLSFVFIYFYNKKSGYKDKYLFYLFYPVHFVIIIFIRYLLQ